MSANIINGQIDEKIWTVHGTNWQIDIPLDAYNAQFTNEIQAHEAASKALKVFKGFSQELFVILDSGENIPYLGETMVVHLKGASPVDPRFSIICFTHEILANQGFYAEATKMARIFIDKVAMLEKEAAANPDPVASLRAAVKICYQSQSAPRRPGKSSLKRTLTMILWMHPTCPLLNKTLN